MSSIMQVLPYSPDLMNIVIDDIKDQTGESAARQIVQLFVEAGLEIKVKHIFPFKPNAYYRVLCFTKKSAETVIINTKQDNGRDGVIDGMSVQIRIEDENIFSKLDEFTENIRDQIINASDCRYCSTKCEGKRYTFPYHGNVYIKCQFLCSNFRFKHIKENDIPNLINIVNGEIEFRQNLIRKP